MTWDVLDVAGYDGMNPYNQIKVTDLFPVISDVKFKNDSFF